MRWHLLCGAVLLAIGVLIGCGGPAEPTVGGVSAMTPAELSAHLGDGAITVIDVRQPSDWNGSDAMVKGAVREDPKADVASWAKKYEKTRPLVLYCA